MEFTLALEFTFSSQRSSIPVYNFLKSLPCLYDNLYCLYKRVIKPAAIMIGNHKCNHGKSKHQRNTQIIIAL